MQVTRSVYVLVCYVRIHREKNIGFSLLRSTHSPLLYMRAPVLKQRKRTSERVYGHEYEYASTAGNSVPVASYASRNLEFAVNVTDVQKYSKFRTNTWYLVSHEEHTQRTVKRTYLLQNSQCSQLVFVLTYLPFAYEPSIGCERACFWQASLTSAGAQV